jgi:uncharacterized protein
MPLPILRNDAARRLFLHLHALAEPPTGPATGKALADLIHRIGFVQVDSINTVERAHHMILWSRRQSYRPPALKHLLERDRAVFEHWTHDASVIPVEHYSHWQHRFERDAVRLQANWRTWFRDGYEDKFDTILRHVSDHGPVTSTDVGQGEQRGKGGWWDWHPSKTALEWLWRTGALAVTRRDGFQKVYDLTERVIPAEYRRGPGDPAEMVEWACSAALDRLGFATSGELAAYWRACTPTEAAEWTRSAQHQGRVIEVEVEGTDGTRRRSYAWPDILARADAAPEPPSRLRILSPFDPALRDRNRTERLFGFHYRIEVFVPEAKRLFGYYVFPVLEGSSIVGRIDAKAFRAEGMLRIKAFWPEPGIAMGPGRVARLQAELARLAGFSGCDKVDHISGWLRDPVRQIAGSTDP